MRKIFTCFVALMAIVAAATEPARAQNSTSTLEFEAKCNGSGTADDGVQWTVTSDGAESNFDNNKGIHYGTNKVLVQYIQLSTSGITGTITQVKVNASTNSGVTATVGVTVGGNAFGTTQSMSSNDPTDYTFTGSASGAIVVRVAKPSAATGALYVKSIEVTYTTAPSGGGSEPYDFADAPTLTIGVNAENRGSVEMLIGTIWDSATWHGWENVIPVNRSASNITLTSVGEQYLHAYQYTYSGLNQGALTLRAKEDENGDATAQQLILTSNANNFQRIEFLMTRDYAAEDYHPMNDLSAWVNKNPNIVPSTGWTFGGKKAIWQGNANSITMTSCSTYVHQMLFTREGDSALVQTSEVANEFKIVSGNEMNVRAMANEGYHLSGWSNGFPVNASQTARVNVVSDTTLRAIFDTNEYVLTVAVAAGQEAMGSVNGSNPAAKHFREYTISATPMPGYLFKQWNDGVTTDSRTVTLTKDMTYTATFVVDTFTLTVNATPDTMGTVTLSAGAGSLPEGVVDNGDGTYRVPYLTQLVAQAVPNSHHHVTGWNTGSVSADMQYDTIVMGAADASLTASFAIDNYTITLVNAVPQAPLPTAVTDNGDSTYTAPYGTEMTIEPVVPQYMSFNRWVGGGTNYDNPRTVTFDQDITYEATFSQQLYIIFASSSDTAKGTVNASYRSGYYGQTRNFTATPKADYAFVNWTEADTVYSTDATIDVVVLGHTRRLTANFAFPNPNPYTIDSIPLSWSVTADGEPVTLTPYTDGNTQKGYATILERASVELIPSAADKNLIKSVTLVKAPAPAGTTIDLATVTTDTTVGDGYTVIGTLGANVKISIADGATVTLDGVTINGENDYNYTWAGINCLGDATIILTGENTVKGFYQSYPGIYVPENKTVTIQGIGSLTASSSNISGVAGAGIGGGYQLACGNITIMGGSITAMGSSGAAGIGSGSNGSCGNITITGGTINASANTGAAGIGSGNNGSFCGNITITGGNITATGGGNAAGIGSGNSTSCGNITITGGTINATGTNQAAGIGSGYAAVNKTASCGTITITNGVTSVTATKGNNTVPNSIGVGKTGNGGTNTCGTVTIGCTLDASGNPVGGTTGAISESPYTYPQN